jgi:hypothetical protein
VVGRRVGRGGGAHRGSEYSRRASKPACPRGAGLGGYSRRGPRGLFAARRPGASPLLSGCWGGRRRWAAWSSSSPANACAGASSASTHPAHSCRARAAQRPLRARHLRPARFEASIEIRCVNRDSMHQRFDASIEIRCINRDSMHQRFDAPIEIRCINRDSMRQGFDAPKIRCIKDSMHQRFDASKIRCTKDSMHQRFDASTSMGGNGAQRDTPRALQSGARGAGRGARGAGRGARGREGVYSRGTGRGNSREGGGGPLGRRRAALRGP